MKEKYQGSGVKQDKVQKVAPGTTVTVIDILREISGVVALPLPEIPLPEWQQVG